MTDRTVSVDGLSGRPRHQSPSSEASSAHSQSSIILEHPAASSVPRRRSSRTKSATEDAPDPSARSWTGAAEEHVLEPKEGRAAPRKSLNANLQTPASLENTFWDNGKDTGGFLPKLSRILEGKESKTPRRKQGSTISSVVSRTSTSRGTRPVGDTRNRSTRQKHSSLQHHVEKDFASLPNPSLLSVISGFTQQSSASNESNSTITQQSYNKRLIAKHRTTKNKKRLPAKKRSSSSELSTMAPQQPSVFQYMDPTTSPNPFRNGHRPSSSSSSATSSSMPEESELHDRSSTAEEHGVETPPTSPASTRKPNAEDSHEDEDSDLENPPEASGGHMLQPSVSEAANDSDEPDDETEEQGDSDDDDKKEKHVNISTTGAQVRHPPYTDRMTLERVPPPKAPSPSSSHHSDRHTRRLKCQEQALNEHMLQSPQPHRGFHFSGGPSPHYYPAMPLYNPYPQAEGSPVSFATAYHAPPAAPAAPLPPPFSQAVGYYSPAPVPGQPEPYSLGYGNETTMTARPPMAPIAVAQPSSQVPYSPMQPSHYQVPPPRPSPSQNTVVGYELLADKLSKSSQDRQVKSGEEVVVPMYRKFESLNHRVLLHLQDEIAELEEELRYLDECIAQCAPRDHAGHPHPASRRSDARYGSEMHYRRTDVLGRIYLKLGQYNSALSSFNTMIKSLDPADAENIQAYRSWMEKRTPIDHTEARFLEHRNDLLTVSESKPVSTVGGVATRQSGGIWLPLVLVFPLMAFAIVPGLLGRLVVLGLTGAGIMKLVTSTTELMEVMTVQEWSFCCSVYFGFMALLAALAH